MFNVVSNANIFRASGGYVPWTSTMALPWTCWEVYSAPRPQLFQPMTYGHCMWCLRHQMFRIPGQLHTTSVENCPSSAIMNSPTKNNFPPRLISLLPPKNLDRGVLGVLTSPSTSEVSRIGICNKQVRRRSHGHRKTTSLSERQLPTTDETTFNLRLITT